MILLVPFVVRASGAKWHSFVVRMYLDNVAAVAAMPSTPMPSCSLTGERPARDLTTQVMLLTALSSKVP